MTEYSCPQCGAEVSLIEVTTLKSSYERMLMDLYMAGLRLYTPEELNTLVRNIFVGAQK